MTPLGTLQSGSPIETAALTLEPGQHLDIPVPQPAISGEASRHCEIGQVAPAASVFHGPARQRSITVRFGARAPIVLPRQQIISQNPGLS